MMADDKDDYHRYAEQKRFLAEIEQGIRLANTEILHQKITDLSRDNILSLAVSVSRLRASYLAAAFSLSINEHGEQPDADQLADLRNKREMYEEARKGFDALRDAIEKGYIDVTELG